MVMDLGLIPWVGLETLGEEMESGDRFHHESFVVGRVKTQMEK